MQENNPIPTPVTIPPVVIEQPKTNSFLTILLSVLLLLSVLIAGFFAYQTQKLVKELTMLKTEEKVAVATTEPTTEPVATNSAVIDMTNWKTYTNTKFGFNFKYPLEWYVLSSNVSFVLLSSQSQITDTSISLSVSTKNVTANDTIDSYFDQMLKSDGEIANTEAMKTSKSSILIDNNKAIRYDSIPKSLGYIENNVILISKGKLFRLTISNNQISDETFNIFDYILSTFKFTN